MYIWNSCWGTPEDWFPFSWRNTLQWRHNGRHGISTHQQLHGLFNYLLWAISKKYQSSALLALCEGNSPVTGEFPSQRASNAERASIWWRHRDTVIILFGAVLYSCLWTCCTWFIYSATAAECITFSRYLLIELFSLYPINHAQLNIAKHLQRDQFYRWSANVRGVFNLPNCGDLAVRWRSWAVTVVRPRSTHWPICPAIG